jgi:hypothetical protein
MTTYLRLLILPHKEEEKQMYKARQVVKLTKHGAFVVNEVTTNEFGNDKLDEAPTTFNVTFCPRCFNEDEYVQRLLNEGSMPRCKFDCDDECFMRHDVWNKRWDKLLTLRYAKPCVREKQ